MDNFSNQLYGKTVSDGQIYKFFRSKGLHPRQKRDGVYRFRCYLGIKYREDPEQWSIF